MHHQTTPDADTLATRLALAMSSRNLTQRGLADLVKKQSGEPLSQVAIQKITSGETRHPKRLPDIARALGVSASWLAHGGEVVLEVGQSGTMGGAHHASAGTMDNAELDAAWTIKKGVVPVVGTAQLGDNGYFEAETEGAGGHLRISSDDADAYALRVVGDSMAPRIKHGEFVLVEPGRAPVPFEECLVQTTDGRKMIKVFIHIKDGFYRFESVNENHGPIHLAATQVESVQYVAGILKSSRFFEAQPA